VVEGAKTTDYAYDALYRLTTETVAGDTHGNNGGIAYTLDKVGNRLIRNSSVASVLSVVNQSYNARDWLGGDSYDANGSTLTGRLSPLAPGLPPETSGTDVYDFENRLILRTKPDGSSINVSYDADGHRIAKTLLSPSAQLQSSTSWLVDTNNHTGYAQVVEELTTTPPSPPSLVPTTRRVVYTYGTSLISQSLVSGPSSLVTSYYSSDGHGNVRELTDSSGNVTDRYDFDAFGLLVFHSGTTSNAYLYCGEQFDADLGLYYLRARYLNPDSGRFWSMDSYEGSSSDPISLHKYLYAHADPIGLLDRSGNSVWQALNELTLRVFLTINIAYPRIAFVIGFAVSLIIPAEVQVGLPAMGSIGNVGISKAWALTKELPALRRAYELAKQGGAKNIAKLGPAGRDFENWVVKVLGATKNTKSYKGGVPVPGNPAGAKIPDVTIFREALLEIKASGGAIDLKQAAEYARIARNEGRGITYIFQIMPSADEIKKLKETIAAVAPNVDVATNALYLK
jgi:RHS repeat-associated protein